MEAGYEEKLIDEAGYFYHMTDKDGNTMKYRKYNGHKYSFGQMPADVPKRLEALKDFPCRDDDIILAVYPKSGTHWIANIAAMVSSGTAEYIGTPPIIEFSDFDVLAKMESPRIFISHLPFECFPTGFKEGKCKIITVSRNPKDVATSFYTFSIKFPDESRLYFGNFSGFLNFFMKGDVVCDGWFDHVKMWGPAKKEYPEKDILFLNYENMKKDLYKNVAAVAEFLGYHRSEEFYREVEKKCTFENMQRDVNKGREPQKEWLSTIKTGILPIYRKGQVGDWKNYFTVAQNELFDRVYEEELKGHDVSYVYNPEEEK